MKKILLTLVGVVGLSMLVQAEPDGGWSFTNSTFTNMPADLGFKDLTWTVGGKTFDTSLWGDYFDYGESWIPGHPDSGPYGQVILGASGPSGTSSGQITFGGTSGAGMQFFIETPHSDHFWLRNSLLLAFAWAGDPGNFDQGVILTSAVLNGEHVDINTIEGPKSFSPSEIVANENTALYLQQFIPTLWSEFPTFTGGGDDGEGSNSVFVTQAEELNIGLTFQDGQWTPAQ
jgi:hypothetical protein